VAATTLSEYDDKYIPLMEEDSEGKADVSRTSGDMLSTSNSWQVVCVRVRVRAPACVCVCMRVHARACVLACARASAVLVLELGGADVVCVWVCGWVGGWVCGWVRGWVRGCVDAWVGGQSGWL
jgi:hypothetical protein